MRGTTVKRLNVYANFWKNTDKQYEKTSVKTIARRLRKLWKTNVEFKNYVQLKVTAEEGQVYGKLGIDHGAAFYHGVIVNTTTS